MEARARRSDPATSHEAAEKVERKGKAESQRQECLNIVRAWPGRTAAEIAHWAELERHVPSRRLPELRKAGLVINGPPRICEAMGTKSLTWCPVIIQGELF